MLQKVSKSLYLSCQIYGVSSTDTQVLAKIFKVLLVCVALRN